MLISFKRFKPSSSKGFTLVELLVVSTIMLIITTFVLFKQAKFDSATLLRSLTYSIALTIRQAQVYGTSVRESSIGSGVFSQGYGVYFGAPGTSATTYTLFADTLPSPAGNGRYDAGEELPIYRLGRGYYISRLCPVSGGVCASVTSLTIFFRRPNPDACFASNLAPGACDIGGATAYSSAYIEVKSAGNDDTRTVKITSTGQIAVCAPNIATLPPASC